MKNVCLLFLVMFLTGCAFGNTHDYRGVLLDLKNPQDKTVALAVHDRRSEILSGETENNVTGWSRGGYGNPFSVRTSSEGPFANDVLIAMKNSLEQKRNKVVPVYTDSKETSEMVVKNISQNKFDVAILLTFNEWFSDTYVNTDVDYNVNLKILNNDSQIIAEAKDIRRYGIGGSFMNPPQFAKEHVPFEFKKIMEQLFEEKNVAQSLAQ